MKVKPIWILTGVLAILAAGGVIYKVGQDEKNKKPKTNVRKPAATARHGPKQ